MLSRFVAKKRNAVNSTFLPFLTNAADRNRTGIQVCKPRKTGGFSTPSFECNQKCKQISTLFFQETEPVPIPAFLLMNNPLHFE